MSLRELRNGAAIAGAVLLILPVVEVAFGAGGIGPEHVATGLFGMSLVGLGTAGRW